MSAPTCESFDELHRRLGGHRLSDQAAEKARLLTYLRDEGCLVHRTENILGAIRSLVNEEELSAYACLEGVAVTHASDGWWLIFGEDEPLPKVDGNARGSEAD